MRFSIVQKMKPYFGTFRPVLLGCINRWSMGISNIQVFALHSLSFIHEEKADGKKRMQQTWEHMLNGLRSVLEHDPNIRPTPLTGSLQWRNLQTSLFSLMLSALLGRTTIPLPLRKSPVGCCMNPPRHGGNFER